MRALILFVSGFFVHLAHASSPGFDLRYPPKAADLSRIEAMGWKSAAESLGYQLAAGYYPGIGGRPGSAGSTTFSAWLNLWRWCHLLSLSQREAFAGFATQFLFRNGPEGKLLLVPAGYSVPPGARPLDKVEVLEMPDDQLADLRHRLLPESTEWFPDKMLGEMLPPGVVRRWISDPAFTAEFFRNLSPGDYVPGVLSTLAELSQDPAFRDYWSLAIAVAIVYDMPIPDFWPHHQVDQSAVPTREPDPPAIFHSWVQADRSRSLLNDLSDLPAKDLKFVIDAPVPDSEFAWARKNARYSKATLPGAFSDVEYDRARIEAEQYQWPHGSYRLQDIRETGGICVDQAYFAMLVGKARGIPTLYFRGQGRDGGHAWFGFKKSASRWNLDVGRYENQNYTVGHAIDPQTGRPISDHELEFLSSGFLDSKPYEAARNDLAMAALFESAGQSDAAASAYQSAVEAAPSDPALHRALIDFLLRTNAPSDIVVSRLEAAITRFANAPDLRTAFQRDLSDVLSRAGDADLSRRLDVQIARRNSRQRPDIVISNSAAEIRSAIDSGNVDAALAEAKSLLRQVGANGGGGLFYEAIRPTARALVEADRPADAVTLLLDTREALRPEPESLLDDAIAKLLNQCGHQAD